MRPSTFARVALALAGVALAMLLLRVTSQAADVAGSPAARWMQWVGPAGAAVLLYVAFTRLEDAPPRARAVAYTAAAYLTALSLVFAIERQDSRSYVEAYCAYGARTALQLDHCKNNVRPSAIDHLATRAAKYARGTVTLCHRDAGPFCADHDY